MSWKDKVEGLRGMHVELATKEAEKIFEAHAQEILSEFPSSASFYMFTKQVALGRARVLESRTTTSHAVRFTRD